VAVGELADSQIRPGGFVGAGCLQAGREHKKTQRPEKRIHVFIPEGREAEE